MPSESPSDILPPPALLEAGDAHSCETDCSLRAAASQSAVFRSLLPVDPTLEELESFALLSAAPPLLRLAAFAFEGVRGERADDRVRCLGAGMLAIFVAV